MPRKQIDVWSGKVWALAAAVVFSAGCPGYLEERAWLADGSSPPAGFDSAPLPTASGGTGGTPSPGGTGGSAAATGGTGGSVTSPAGTGGTGGATGQDGGVRTDAGPPRDGNAAPRDGGGGGADANSAAPQPCSSASEIASKILMPRCAICHGANMPAAALDLATAGSKARILNKPSIACNGKPLATPDGNGHFFDKLAGAIPGCGNQMPFGGIMPLSAAEVQCLRDWIKTP
jgi:hypothetical protein